MKEADIERMIAFVKEIGIDVKECSFTHKSLIPGFDFGDQCIIMDRSLMKYPGDLLHEAGHLAVVPGSKRRLINSLAPEPVELTDGEEIGAILWSYAALRHLEIAPEVVFHESGYKGDSKWIMDQFESGAYIGLPLLEWAGMAYTPEKAEIHNVRPFPHMIHWLNQHEIQ